MRDRLTGLLARARETQTEHDVVETGLENPHEVLARDSLHAACLVEVTAELLFEYAIDELGLLLLAKLTTVLALLATALLGLHLGFLGIAQHDGVDAQLAAALQNRGPVNCHDLLPF